MKRLILFAFLAGTILSANAQESSYNSVVNKNREEKNLWKPYAGITFQHLVVKTNTMPGLELGFTINENFLLGIYGQGTSGNFSHLNDEVIYNVMTGEIGLLAGYVMNPGKVLHVGGTLKLGYVSQVADDLEIKLFQDFEPLAEDNGMVYHPEIFSELNLSRYMKIRLGAGYSFYLLNDEKIMCNTELDSWTLNMGFVFSNFAK